MNLSGEQLVTCQCYIEKISTWSNAAACPKNSRAVHWFPAVGIRASIAACRTRFAAISCTHVPSRIFHDETGSRRRSAALCPAAFLSSKKMRDNNRWNCFRETVLALKHQASFICFYRHVLDRRLITYCSSETTFNHAALGNEHLGRFHGYLTPDIDTPEIHLAIFSERGFRGSLREKIFVTGRTSIDRTLIYRTNFWHVPHEFDFAPCEEKRTRRDRYIE